MLEAAALEAPGAVGQRSGSGPRAELPTTVGFPWQGQAELSPTSTGCCAGDCVLCQSHRGLMVCCLVSQILRKKYYKQNYSIIYWYSVITVLQSTFLSEDLLQVPVYLILELKVEDN